MNIYYGILAVFISISGAIGVRGPRLGAPVQLSRIEPAVQQFQTAAPPSPRERARSALDASQQTVDAIQVAIGAIVRDVSSWQEQASISASSTGASEAVASLLVEQLPKDRDALAQVKRTMEFLESRWKRAQGLRAEAVRTASGQAEVEATRRTLGRAAESAAVAYLMRNVAASQQAEGAVTALLSELAPLQRAALAWRERMEKQAGEAAESERARLLAALSKVNSTRSEVQATYAIAGAAARLLERIDHALEQGSAKGIGQGLTMLGALQQCEILPVEESPDHLQDEHDAMGEESRTGSGGDGEGGDGWPQHSLPARLELPVLSESSAEQCQDDWESLSQQYPGLASAMRGLAAAARAAAAAEAEGRAAAAAALSAQARAAQRWQGATNGTSAGLNGQEAAQAALDSMLRAMRAALAAGASHRLGLDAAMRRPAEALSDEADAVDKQAARLRSARQVLERELALRKERWQTGMGMGLGFGSRNKGGKGDPLGDVVAASSPLKGGEGSALMGGGGAGRGSLEMDGDAAAARAAKDVAGQLEGTALARSSQAIGVPAAAALVAHRPDQLWREAATLSDEARSVREERKRCIARPTEYREGCAGRMKWEADRLVDEAARRRAAVAGQAAAAAEVAREVREARDECDRRGGGLSKSGKDAASGGEKEGAARDTCGPEQRAALSTRLGRLSAWMSAARDWREEWTERGSLRCLWERRKLPVAAIVAKSLEQPPVDEAPASGQEEQEGGGAAEAALDPAVAGPRLRRLLQVCSALRGPAVQKQEGAPEMAACLCDEAEAERKLLLRAQVLAKRSAAARDAQASAATQARAEAERTRAAADEAEEAKAKAAVFEYLKQRGQLDDVLRSAMAGAE